MGNSIYTAFDVLLIIMDGKNVCKYGNGYGSPFAAVIYKNAF